MTGYLICEDGPQIGLVIPLTEGNEWVIGRDPTLSTILLEDPMVSRKHGIIRLVDDLFYLENISEVNPIKINGEPSSETPLQEDDTLQIGNNYFRFSEYNPKESSSEKKGEIPSILPFTIGAPSRFFIKVLSGPNQGAEFGMSKDKSYLLGKDSSCDIVFQDLSVSNKHARLSIGSDGGALIEDLGSRNGIVINGLKIESPTPLSSNGVVSLGTTLFLFVDKEASEQTIYSPPPRFYEPEEAESSTEESKREPVQESPSKKNWKETFIPTKHLILASTFSLLLFVGFISLISLFRSQSIEPQKTNRSKELAETFSRFPGIQYSYNEMTKSLFLIGHVLTEMDYAELNYLLKSLPFIVQVEDNVIVDEGVWQEMNALLSLNPNWRGILMSAVAPGHFVLRGYLQSESDATPLQDYINLNFPYLNLLDNQVIIENTLQTQVENLLIGSGFMNIELQMGNGEVIISGRVPEKQKSDFQAIVHQIQSIPGVRQVRNFVIYASDVTSLIDLTSKYHVMGSSKFGNTNQYVLISGKILAVGDLLDGMAITSIETSEIFLEKDGIKYKIDYNQQ